MMELKKLKIKKVTELKYTRVHDLTVAEAQHYISSNGAVNHNTGPAYAASVVLMLNRAQLKDGADKVGIIVTAKPDKNRFAKPHPIKFHLHFTEGMNKYVGLEQYVSWDLCGVARGVIEKGEKIERDTARTWICKHLDKTVKNKDFFTDKVFTHDVLVAINKHIYPIFNYNVDSTYDVLEDILSEDVD